MEDKTRIIISIYMEKESNKIQCPFIIKKKKIQQIRNKRELPLTSLVTQ